MLARRRGQHRLAIDAGVREQQPHGLEGPDDPPFALRRVFRLTEPGAGARIDPARVGGRRHPYPAVFGWRCGEPFERAHARFAHGLAVGHHVRPGDLDEIRGIEEPPDRDLLLERDPARFAVGTVRHFAFERGELHAGRLPPEKRSHKRTFAAAGRWGERRDSNP